MLDVLRTWWNVSARTAADYLPRFRAAEIGDGTLDVALPRLDLRQAAQGLDWLGSTNVLWHIAQGQTQQAAWQAARSLFLGVFHEMVLTGGRQTITQWAGADPRCVGWRRVSDGDPCAFCAMLVTRGPAYTSEAKASLSARTGDKYHPHCGCTVEPVYGDWTPTKREQQWIDQYFATAESLPEGTPRTARTILPRLRRDGQFRDSKARRSTPEALAERRQAYAARRVPDAYGTTTARPAGSALPAVRRPATPAEALGKQGRPMGIDRADRSNANPLFDLRNDCRNNCQSCVPAYEMRRRGYDVEALPFDSEVQQRIRKDSTLAWINPSTGRQPSRRHVGIRSTDAAIRRIRERIQPGQRYAMEFGWNKMDENGRIVMGEGHVVALERPVASGGRNIMVVDPQTGEKLTVERYLEKKDIYLRSLAIYRIDNLELNPRFAADLMKARTS